MVSTQWWVLVAVGAVMPGAGDGYCLGVATVVTTIGDPGTWPGCGWAFSLILSCVEGLDNLDMHNCHVLMTR